MWADAQRDGRPAEYRWCHLQKFRNSMPCTTPQFGWRPLLECSAVMLPIYENATLGRKVNFARSKIPSGVKRKSPPTCIHSVPAQETAKHRARFGWPPVNNIDSVTKAKCETRWNLLGCPKLVNRSQPLVGRSLPYGAHMWRRYCCLTSFFPIVDTCLSCEDSAQQICAMVPRWRFLRHFCLLYFQRAVCSTFQTCVLNSHKGHTMYGRHPLCDRWD